MPVCIATSARLTPPRMMLRKRLWNSAAPTIRIVVLTGLISHGRCRKGCAAITMGTMASACTPRGSIAITSRNTPKVNVQTNASCTPQRVKRKKRTRKRMFGAAPNGANLGNTVNCSNASASSVKKRNSLDIDGVRRLLSRVPRRKHAFGCMPNLMV